MSSASGKSSFGANSSASFQARFFKRAATKRNRSSATTLRKLPAHKTKRQNEDENKATLTRWQLQKFTRSGSIDSDLSGSGQSPNSVDSTGSPPAIMASPYYARPGYNLGAEGFETKRQSISSFHKCEETGGNNVIKRREGRQSSVLGNSSPWFFFSSCSNEERPELPHSLSNPSSPRSKSVNNVTNPSSTQSSCATGPTLLTNTSISEDSDDSNYHPYLTTITSFEQRKRYKSDFDSDFGEYLKLYPLAAKACERFIELGEKRRRELASGNRGNIEEIEQQIRQQYEDVRRDPLYRAKIRFDYLHEKLCHLQRLVEEYDRKNFQLSSSSDSNQREQEGGNRKRTRNG